MKKIIMVLSKRPLGKELDPFRNDPDLDLVNKVFIKNKSPQILEGIEGIIFYHNIDLWEVEGVVGVVPTEIKKVRVFPPDFHGRHERNMLAFPTLLTIQSAFEKMKELLN